ncbi:MAG: hypothetical protein IM571_09055 [Chitinophagaceae bacterium]|nr:hypothetical protein [Chitinophagaceae bacterium]
MYIYGNGGHGHVIFEIAELLGINVEGFIDDYNLFNDLNIPVIRSLSIERFDCVIGIGNNLVRKKVVQ